MTEMTGLVNGSTNTRRRDRLLDAMARLVVRYGYDKTSVEEIAREAGVSKGAVYLHWPSKEALFDAALRRAALSFLDDYLARVEADPAGGTLAAIYRHSLEAIAASPLLLALYTRDARTLGDYARRQDPARYRQRMAFGEAFVRRMQAAGLMRSELDPALTTYVMGVISFGVLSMSQLGSAVAVPPLGSLGAALGDLVQRGLGDDVGSSEAGKRAIRDLIEETIEETKGWLLAAEAAPTPAANGSTGGD